MVFGSEGMRRHFFACLAVALAQPLEFGWIGALSSGGKEALLLLALG